MGKITSSYTALAADAYWAWANIPKWSEMGSFEFYDKSVGILENNLSINQHSVKTEHMNTK